MIGVVARIKVVEGKEQAFENIVRELVAKVRENEAGCLMYSVNRSQSEAGVYITMERYVDREALETHQSASYILDTKPLHAEFFAEQPTIEYLDPLPE